MNWYPVELHTHTQHSDGDFTVEALVAAAKQRGFAAIACTDHNTVSGLPELYAQTARAKLVPIPGIEWTTYWGHMLVLGEHGYTNWCGVRREQIDGVIAHIHANGGIVGIAHPFALGNPINTGYHWEFYVSDWEDIDFLEVWSRDDGPVKIQSMRAVELWERLLQRGCKITGTTGRDWHREDTKPYAHTYVGIEGALTTEGVLDAVRHGRACLAAGPLLTMRLYAADGTMADVGDTVPVSAEPMALTLNVTADTMPNDWDPAQVRAEAVRVVLNGEEIYRGDVRETQRITLPLRPGWLRADLIGAFHGREDQCIAMTNPIYLD